MDAAFQPSKSALRELWFEAIEMNGAGETGVHDPQEDLMRKHRAGAITLRHYVGEEAPVRLLEGGVPVIGREPPQRSQEVAGGHRLVQGSIHLVV